MLDFRCWFASTGRSLSSGGPRGLECAFSVGCDLYGVVNESASDFDNWFRDAYPDLLASLAVAFGDLEVARDVASEAFARAWERWPQVCAMDSPTGWVYRVAVNAGRRHFRRQRVERRLLGRAEGRGNIEGPAGELWMVVAKLPTRQRLAVVLRHVGQLREPEIAVAMNVSRGTVSSTLRAAYRNLRAELTDERTLEVDHERA